MGGFVIDAEHYAPLHRCNASGCEREGEDMYDWYGIYAGRYCATHRREAPGQFDYRANPGEVEAACFDDGEG